MPTNAKHHALVVDWDFFFHIERDWGWAHAESQFFINGIWPLRAAPFVQAGEPLPSVNDDWLEFFDRFRFAEGVRCFVADSNVYAHQAITMVVNGNLSATSVWLFDQHHDCGYQGSKSIAKIARDKQVTCEDWMIPLGLAQNPKGGLLHVVYPDHREDALDMEPEPVFDRMERIFEAHVDYDALPDFGMVFVCRSGAWVPPWEDRKFIRFVKRLPAVPLALEEWEPRKWSIKDARAIAKQTEAAMRAGVMKS